MEQITIKEVAKLCGVGVSTVSRAINNHPDINPETKQKILDAIREYNYVPNNSARNLKRADSNTIAVIIKEISNSYWGVMLHVLEREVRDRKYCLVLQNVADDEDEVELALQLEKEKKVKGIIFLGGMYNYDESRLRMLRVPYVISGSGKTVPEDTGTYPKSALVTTDTEIWLIICAAADIKGSPLLLPEMKVLEDAISMAIKGHWRKMDWSTMRSL